MTRPLLVACLLTSWTTTSLALSEGAPDLVLGSGQRHVPSEDLPERADATPPIALEASPEAGKKSAPSSHKKGKAPKTPLSTLPEGEPLSTPSSARASIVAGGGAMLPPSPELKALREAEEALFPTALPGISAGFSWDLPDTDGTTFEGRAATRLDDADSKWLATLAMPDLPVRMDRRVVTYLKFYRDSARGRTITAIWAKTSGRYVESIKAALRRAGLPSDLVWLSMIESGHNPTIASPVGALGLWQFMPDAARTYGLTVDRWVDERRDPARATQAAIKFLSDLYQRFGSWELAMAAYNMGHVGLARAVTKFNTNDYFTLSRLEGGIPWETTLYVPKIFALAIVMNNREAFGLKNVASDPNVPLDTILVAPGTPLVDVAKAAEISLEELRAKNPALVGDRVPLDPAKTYPILLPENRAKIAQKNLLSKGKPKNLHRLVFGEDLETLSKDYGLTVSSIVRENGLASSGALPPGSWLSLPTPESSPKRKGTPAVVSRRIVPPRGYKLVFYEVRPGDELASIAGAFGLSTSELCRDSALDPKARLRDGMMLAVLVKDSQDLSRVRYLSGDEATILVAGSPEFHEFFEGQKGLYRIEVVANEGDSLQSIGKKYGMSVGSMERVNRRSRGSKLVVGETLVVYTSQEKTADSPLLDGESLPPLNPPRPDLLAPELVRSDALENSPSPPK